MVLLKRKQIYWYSKLLVDSGSTGPLESGLQDNKDKDDDDEEEDAELEFKANQPDVTHPAVAPRYNFREDWHNRFFSINTYKYSVCTTMWA